MNYNSMTDMEMLHYLDMYSDDPVIRRLVDVLGNTRGRIIADLEEAGMDTQTWTFRTDWGSMYPGEYIEELRKDLRVAEDELDHMKYKYDDILEERDRLKVRNIMDFIEEVRQEKITNQELVKEAMKTVKAFKDENERLKEQIDMWGKLNQVKERA